MKIVIASVGTRGDVQPYIALGLGYKQAGHQVKILADPGFEDTIRNRGLEFYGVSADPRKAFQDSKMKSGINPLGFFTLVRRQFNDVAGEVFRGYYEAAKDADLLVASSLAFPLWHVAEALDKPVLAAYLHPLTPTKAFPSMLSPPLPAWLPFKGTYNRATLHMNNVLFFRLMYRSINECREEILGLPALPWRSYRDVDLLPLPILYGFSRYVLPKPADWQTFHHVTGYWFLEHREDWQPPAELIQFIQSGPPPICVGFGSMIDKDAQQLAEVVTEALDLAGVRAVLLGGWSNLGGGELPDTVIKLNEVPHDWLFPQMAAAVHHGGMGTTAAAFRAGIPSVVVPFMNDQPFWGRKVFRLGTGPEPISRRMLTVGRLADAIRQAVNESMFKKQASLLAQKINTEDGVREAVHLTETYMRTPDRLKVHFNAHESIIT